jgi:perosamine synthetase
MQIKGVDYMIVPFMRPRFWGNDIDVVQDIMTEGRNISSGPERDKFEMMFEDYIHCDHALAVCNGTVALEMIWETLIRDKKLHKGDYVICPSFTFVAVANAIVNAGLKPFFVDVKSHGYNMEIPQNITLKGKLGAVCAVHTYGKPCDLSEIVNYCDDHDLILVEDCAEACGADYNGKKVGCFGHASAFSFNATKNLTTGEGGMACFNYDTGTPQAIREHGDLYHTRNALVVGHNYRLCNILCALGLSQLESLDVRNALRRIKAQKYMDNFYNKKVAPGHVYQLFPIVVNDRDRILKHLWDNGIEAKKYFDPPIHHQTAHRTEKYLPNTNYVAEHVICLPFDEHITDDEIKWVCECLK